MSQLDPVEGPDGRETTPAADGRSKVPFKPDGRKAPAALISIVAGLAVWEFVGRVLVTNDLFFVPFTEVAKSIYDLTIDGTLPENALVTFQEVIIGLLLACVLGIPIGILMAVVKPFRAGIQPWISGLYSTPMVALAPLFILWFGIGISSKIATALTMGIFPIIINTHAGMANVDQSYIDVARAFGCGRACIFMKVLVPAALAYIVTGVKLGVGRAIVGAVIAEIFGSRAGLGWLILSYSQAFQTAPLLASVVVLALAGIVGLWMVERLEVRLAPWKQSLEV